MNEKPVKLLWTTTAMGGRSSLPIPGERSNNDFSGPPSSIWSPWIGTRCSKTYTVLQLYINSESLREFSTAQLAVLSFKFLQTFTHNHFLTIFPFPQMKTPESHSAEWILPGVKTEQPKLSSLSTFKDCLGLNWDNCHLMSHLPTFHFLGESWPQI